MDNKEIEKIFSEEYTKFHNSVSTLDSLVLELQDISHGYTKLKNNFSNMVKTKNCNSETIKDMLELHLSLVVRLTDINKEISDILYPLPVKVSE